MSLCNNSSDNKSYWIHRVDVKVSAQVTTVTYMHQSQPSLHSLRNNLTVHLELWPGNHLIWCNATLYSNLKLSLPMATNDQLWVKDNQFVWHNWLNELIILSLRFDECFSLVSWCSVFNVLGSAIFKYPTSQFIAFVWKHGSILFEQLLVYRNDFGLPFKC